MAHWAQIDKKNIVIQVVATNNDDENGDEGFKWLQDNLGGTWVQTSYNAKIRGKYAGIGDIYDAELDRFIPASPYPSWKLSKDFTWDAPKAYPSDGKVYDWDEAKKDWLERVVISGN